MSISAPNFIDATGAIARLSMLRVRRGRKVWVAGVATLIIVIFLSLIHI